MSLDPTSTWKDVRNQEWLRLRERFPHHPRPAVQSAPVALEAMPAAAPAALLPASRAGAARLRGAAGVATAAAAELARAPVRLEGSRKASRRTSLVRAGALARRASAAAALP